MRLLMCAAFVSGSLAGLGTAGAQERPASAGVLADGKAGVLLNYVAGVNIGGAVRADREDGNAAALPAYAAVESSGAAVIARPARRGQDLSAQKRAKKAKKKVAPKAKRMRRYQPPEVGRGDLAPQKARTPPASGTNQPK